MKAIRTFSALGAACVFGALAMAAQTLLLRRFLWRFEAAEEGVALFLATWLFWSGMGAAAAFTRLGRRVTGALSKAAWLAVAACAGLYFAQYGLVENLRSWVGVQEYEQFPLLHLVAGCLLANVPFCFAAGFVIPSVCRRLAEDGVSVSRAFAWEALGAAAGGVALTLLLARGIAPDPRDEAEWRRFFPQADVRPGRFETGGGTTFYGTRGGTFYALSSGGVSETIPEAGRAVEVAMLALSQRPYAKDVALLGRVPLSVGLALEAIRPDLSIVWCPCDAQYGLRLLEAVRGSGTESHVRAAGLTPQRFLDAQGDGAFDVVLVSPPQATTLEGAAWRQEAFAQRVRCLTRRTGAALFGLDCDAAVLTPERGALLDVAVRGIRRAWPEAGVFAAGAGGWWVAAQVPGLAYRPEDAAARFALLKRDSFPAQAVTLLYDAERAQSLARQCPALDAETPVSMPQTESLEETLALGLADGVRRAYPDLTPGTWLARLKTADVSRLAGLLLVALWMLPVAAGRGGMAGRRMLAAWVGACGALGLTASLTVLYRLQLGFGLLYLLAGAGSCLYLAGLFCGNRLCAAVAEMCRARRRLLRLCLFGCGLLEACLAFGVAVVSARVATEYGLILLCFAAGCGAGAAVPIAFAACGEDGAGEAPAVFVLSDALGAAAAGLAFVLLVPLAGLVPAVGCFAALVCGVSLCAAACGEHARLTAGLALLAALLAFGGQVRDLRSAGGFWESEADGAAAVAEGPRPRALESRSALPGVPRRVDLPRIREQISKGLLATNAAVFWE